VTVRAGEFLLAVNGQDLRGEDDVFRLFQATAGKQTVLTVGPNASGTGSRQVTVVPIASEEGLRLRTWMEDNDLLKENPPVKFKRPPYPDYQQRLPATR
jgi:tricorn protease